MLAMITVALWGLLLTQLTPSNAGASAGAPALATTVIAPEQEAQASQSSPEEVRVTRGPVVRSTATLPLVHRVTFATRETSYNTYCETPIIVHNPTSSSVSVEVEWFVAWGSAIELATRSMSGGAIAGFTGTSFDTGAKINNNPMWLDLNYNRRDTGDFDGYAYVYSDDPRIIVSAFVTCRTNVGTDPGVNVVSVANVPVVPVGNALMYYQAGVPGTVSPPAAIAETPERSQMHR
jgi:hypothetical protein